MIDSSLQVSVIDHFGKNVVLDLIEIEWLMYDTFVGVTTSAFTLFICFEAIRIATTTAIHKLLTFTDIGVEVVTDNVCPTAGGAVAFLQKATIRLNVN